MIAEEEFSTKASNVETPGLDFKIKVARVDLERISMNKRVLTLEDPGGRVSLIKTLKNTYRVIKSHNFDKIQHSMVVLDNCSTCEKRFGTRKCQRGEKWVVRRERKKNKE